MQFQDKVDQSLRLNDQRQKEDPMERDKKFFGQLPRSIIIQLYYAYKIDFDMFGYEEPKEYIEMGYILPDEENDIGPPKNDPRRNSNMRSILKRWLIDLTENSQYPWEGKPTKSFEPQSFQNHEWIRKNRISKNCDRLRRKIQLARTKYL